MGCPDGAQFYPADKIKWAHYSPNWAPRAIVHWGGLSAPTELCFAVTALAVQAYNAISSDVNIKMKLLTSGSDQCALFTKALRLFASSRSVSVLNQVCSKQHENFDVVVQSAFNCFAKNELKRLNSRKAEPPAKMQRTARKLNSSTSVKKS